MKRKKQKKLSNPKSRALRLLTIKNRTTAELSERLIKEGYPADEVDEVITWLTEIGYLNDRLTAEYWVDYRCRFRPTGIIGLSFELKQKGVGEQIISEVMISRDKELELAMELAEKRLKTMSNLTRETKQRRILGLLNRRGFSWDTIRNVLDAVIGSSLDTNL